MGKRVLQSGFRIAFVVCLACCISCDSMLKRMPRNYYSQDEIVDRPSRTVHTETPHNYLSRNQPPFIYQPNIVDRPSRTVHTETPHKAQIDLSGNQPPFIYHPNEEPYGTSKSRNYGLIAFVIAIIALAISFVRLLFEMLKTLVQLVVKAAITNIVGSKDVGTSDRIKEEQKHSGNNKAEHNPTPPSHEE